jgi:hypothetical protein
MTELEKCAHSRCGCDAPDGEDYCSPSCRDFATRVEGECSCGHAGCVDESE